MFKCNFLVKCFGWEHVYRGTFVVIFLYVGGVCHWVGVVFRCKFLIYVDRLLWGCSGCMMWCYRSWYVGFGGVFRKVGFWSISIEKGL